ncbi:hypothetical protein [Methylorubrum extorquens]|uniref:hypothetical protein n=1 Tax=Methylorubrum extorquens TaxID=408 RepID=UPI0009B5FD97|nr:hypothetical protein [Methylorubrum extorquens]
MRSPGRLRRPSDPWSKGRPCTNLELGPPRGGRSAGRAAEIVVLGEASTGSASDLAEATVLCRNMHARWGLGRRIAVREASELPRDLLLVVEQHLQQASDLAVSIIVERRASLDRLAETLLARRSLEGREATAIIGSPPSD